MTSSAYSNAELGFPDTALVTLHYNYVPNQAYFATSQSQTSIFGDRAQSYDRYYIGGADTPASNTVKNTDGTTIVLENIAVANPLFYFRDGAGLQGIFRGSNATAANTNSGGNNNSGSTSGTTLPSNVSDYGVAGDAYVGFGVDGGLVGATNYSSLPSNQAVFSNGNYRVEALIDAKYVDLTSIESLYPSAKSPKQYVLTAGGQVVWVITGAINLNVSVAYPIGYERRYIGRSVMGGFTLSR
jgi:hypothetical protein